MNLTTLKTHSIPVFGDVTKRGAQYSELAEQVSFLAILRHKYPDLEEIAVHIENEGKRGDAAKKKLQGMKTGASDIMIPCSPPILIELKKADHTQSSVSAHQLAYLAKAQRLGAFVCVALGAAGAMEAVEAWHTTHRKK